MSKDFVATFKFGMDRAFNLYEKFLLICPDAIWQNKFGGWKVSQQFYHALRTSSMFISSITNQPIDNPCPMAGDLLNDNGSNPSKEEAKKFFEDIMSSLKKLISSLDDDELKKINTNVSKLLGAEVNNAETLNLMLSHMLYHLGSCDAALREQGLEGAF